MDGRASGGHNAEHELNMKSSSAVFSSSVPLPLSHEAAFTWCIWWGCSCAQAISLENKRWMPGHRDARLCMLNLYMLLGPFVHVNNHRRAEITLGAVPCCCFWTRQSCVNWELPAGGLNIRSTLFAAKIDLVGQQNNLASWKSRDYRPTVFHQLICSRIFPYYF